MRQHLVAGVLAITMSDAAAVEIIDLPGYPNAIAAFATSVSLSGNFVTNVGSPANSITDQRVATYVYSNSNRAVMQISFGAEIHNGAGDDLSVFFVGGGMHAVSLSLVTGATATKSKIFSNTSYTGYCVDNNDDQICGGPAENPSNPDQPIHVMQIDFDIFHVINQPIDAVLIDIGKASATPSLVGAHHLLEPDTDTDGIPDSIDNCINAPNGDQTDTDADSVGDVCDNCAGTANADQLDAEADGVGDICDPDDDNDGLDDAAEAVAGSNPFDPDTDDDGLSDSVEVGLGTSPLLVDTDGDGLSDKTETDLGTNPLLTDTDSDGLSDRIETDIGTSPLLVDTDGDSLSDGDEVQTGTNPLSQDSDDDGLGDAVDVLPLDFHFMDGDLAPLGSPNGLLDAADLLIAVRIVLGGLQPGTRELTHGDIYPPGLPDGVIDIRDLILLQPMIE